MSGIEITSKYTVEDWETHEIEIRTIPDAVYSQSFEEVLIKCFAEIGSTDLNPIELIFANIFLHEGWNVVRTPMSNSKIAPRYIAAAIEDRTGVSNALYGPGVPDFFLWTSDGQHRFIEIKASEDSLNNNQREWAETYDWNFSICQLAYLSEELSDEEIIENNKIL